MVKVLGVCRYPGRRDNQGRRGREKERKEKRENPFSHVV